MSRILSRVNCPERVILNSNDDTTSTIVNDGFNSFTIQLPTPILSPSRLQLNRASFPAATLQIPDYGLCFFYYRLAAFDSAPTSANLRCVRLYPSNFQPYSGYTTYSKNRYFTGASDLVTALNVAAAAGGDNTSWNPLWQSADITFTFNSTTNQITFRGLSATFWYAPAGWNDPNVANVLSGAVNPMLLPTFNGGGIVSVRQPQAPQVTLNLRVGYTLSGTAPGSQSFGGGNQQYADLTNTSYASGTAVPVDALPNLVNTNQVSFYCDFANGSSLTSSNKHNLLASVPITVPAFGVVSYNQQNEAYLTKVSNTINSVVITMLDDYEQPYQLPDSATVLVEISFDYDGNS